MGALTVAQSDPNVIYAGMGESTIRIDVSFGDGVYKSVDAGKTWKNVGLRKTRHIGEILVNGVFIVQKMVEKTGTRFFFAAKKLVQLI